MLYMYNVKIAKLQYNIIYIHNIYIVDSLKSSAISNPKELRFHWNGLCRPILTLTEQKGHRPYMY